MKQIWKGEKRQKAEHLIGRLLAEKKSNGWTVSFQNELYFRALRALSERTLSHGEILQTLTEMEKEGETGCRGFEKLRKAIQGKSWGNNRKWSLYMPWYVKPKPEIRLSFQMTVAGVCFKVSNWTYSERKIRQSKLWSDLRLHCEGDREVFSGLCLSAVATGRTPHEAWDNLTPAVDALRGCVELTFGLGSQTWSSPPRPKCAVPHPFWVVMFPDFGNPEWFHFIVDGQDIKEAELGIKTMKVLRKNTRLFRISPGDGFIDELLLDCVRLYAQAMDERLPHRALLSWWQLAEALTLSIRFNGDTKTVVRRLTWLIRSNWTTMDLTGIEESLLALAEYRNDIVHRGESRYVNEEDCNFIKLVCETALIWLAQNRKKICSISVLEKAYLLSCQSDHEMGNLRQALGFI